MYVGGLSYPIAMFAFFVLSVAAPGTDIDRATEIANKCRNRRFRCELRCGETTRGGQLKRLRCYERCASHEAVCREEGAK